MAITQTHTPERRLQPDRRLHGVNASANSINAIAAPRRMTGLDVAAMVLLIIGGVNWGLIGFFGFNLVASLFGDMTALSRLVYALVGLAAIYSIYTTTKLFGRHDSTSSRMH